MRTTIKDAVTNKHNLEIRQTGYGHWRISCDYRNKRISTITTDSMAIDDYRSDIYEIKDRRNRHASGYGTLINYIVNKYNGFE